MPAPSLPLCDQDVESIERATLDAVAPPAVQAIDGWLLPFDHSSIGRAKSAVPLRHHSLHAADIATIEALYAARGLPAAFRLADTPALADLQRELGRRGYQAEQPTLVQLGAISRMQQLCPAPAATCSEVPTQAWASVYLAQGFDPVDGAHRVQALSRSPCVVYACVEEMGQAIASGTAAFSHGWASVHGMRTLPEARGRGLAADILAGLAGAATQRALDRAFLQVEEDNTSALALYRRAGFVTAWRYHYWRRT